MKKRRIYSLMLVFVMLTTFVFGDYVFADGEDTADIPSYITKTNINGVEYLEFDSGEDMAWLRQHVMNKEDGGTG